MKIKCETVLPRKPKVEKLSNETILANVITGLEMAVVVFDACEKCHYCSPLVSGYIGKSPLGLDDFLTALTSELPERQRILRGIGDFRNGKKIDRIEVHHNNGNAKRRTFLVDLVIQDSGTEELLCVVLQDTSSGSGVRRELEDLARLASLGQVTAGVAHEFNNILTSVLGWTQIARQSPDADSVISALEIIEGNARRAKEIASRLLDTSSKNEESTETFLVIDMVEEVLRLLSWEMAGTGIKVAKRFSNTGYCHGNINRLGQVIINIVRNAMDAMKAGGVLDIKICQQEGEVVTSITDSGPGIGADEIERIFDPFFTTKRRADLSVQGGTGLGLSICLDIVEEYGGRLEVKSEPGRGTCFKIYLPIAEDTSSPILEKPGDQRTTIPFGVSVLVADDEPDIGEMIQTALMIKGATVVAANNGAKAVELCRSRGFDAAFVDFNMPGLSGYELCRELYLAQPEMPIVIMSGQQLQVDTDVPVANFLKKPFDLDDIQQMLRIILKSDSSND